MFDWIVSDSNTWNHLSLLTKLNYLNRTFFLDLAVCTYTGTVLIRIWRYEDLETYKR